MKTRFTAAVLMATTLFAQGVYAKTLEEILKDKGVITEEDYKEAVKSRPASYKLGQGYSFTSDDGNFRLALGSQLQIRYDFFNPDRANGNGSGSGAAVDFSKFQIRRAKLIASGNATTPNLTYLLTINLANINGGSTSNGGLLEETYLHYKIIDGAQLRFGQDKVQFGRGFITPSSKMEFVDTSNIVNAFVPGYDTGLSLNGDILKGIVRYTVGVYGGAGQNTFRTTNDNAFSARIVYNPLGNLPYGESDVEYTEKPLFSIAASYFKDTLARSNSAFESNQLTFAKSTTLSTATPGGWISLGQAAAGATKFGASEKVDFDLFGVDTAFKWKGLFFQGEYFLAQANGRTSHLEQIGQGFYLQGGYFVIPKKLELAARYGYMDPNRSLKNALWTETTGAISYYFNSHCLKLQGDFTSIHRQGRIATTNASATATPTDDNLFRLQAQLLF